MRDADITCAEECFDRCLHTLRIDPMDILFTLHKHFVGYRFFLLTFISVIECKKLYIHIFTAGLSEVVRKHVL